jgi:hypothetical protein
MVSPLDMGTDRSAGRTVVEAADERRVTLLLRSSCNIGEADFTIACKAEYAIDLSMIAASEKRRCDTVDHFRCGRR